jgi:hypothetical protein
MLRSRTLIGLILVLVFATLAAQPVFADPKERPSPPRRPPTGEQETTWVGEKPSLGGGVNASVQIDYCVGASSRSVVNWWLIIYGGTTQCSFVVANLTTDSFLFKKIGGSWYMITHTVDSQVYSTYSSANDAANQQDGVEPGYYYQVKTWHYCSDCSPQSGWSSTAKFWVGP